MSVWKTLSSKTVYKNKFITVQEDEVIRPDGSRGVYGYVKIPRTVGIVAMDSSGFFYLCKQSRYIFKEESWEIPRGFVDNSESFKQAAMRELKEEAGLSSPDIVSVGSIRTSIGVIDEEAEIFLAKDVVGGESTDDSHEIDKVKKFTLEDILEMIKENKIKDGLTIGAIQKISHYLVKVLSRSV
ncbi:MAG: NUDIX hydrolase [Patescibacteria group bacterium]